MTPQDPVPPSTASLQLGRYRHYKGKDYEVLGTVRHSETEEVLVLYRPLYGARDLWVRPLDMFLETVTVEGAARPRFQWLHAGDGGP